MCFLCMLFGEFNKVESPTVVSISYEWFDDNDVKTVQVIIIITVIAIMYFVNLKAKMRKKKPFLRMKLKHKLRWPPRPH